MILKEAVQNAWDNAYEGGYADWLLTSEPIDVGMDMMDCDADVEALAYGNVDEVVGLVRLLQKGVDIFP